MSTGLNILRLVNLWPPFGEGRIPAAGPYRVAAGDVFHAGAVIGDTFTAGRQAGDVFHTGAVTGEVR